MKRAPYDGFASLLREWTEAEGVFLLIVQGARGSSWALDISNPASRKKLARLLRVAADDLDGIEEKSVTIRCPGCGGDCGEMPRPGPTVGDYAVCSQCISVTIVGGDGSLRLATIEEIERAPSCVREAVRMLRDSRGQA